VITIGVSGTVAVILIILGVLAYVSDGAKKIRDRRRRDAVQEKLNQDLRDAKPSTRLPYGFSQEAERDADNR